METHDGVPIHVHNRGLWSDPTPDDPDGYALTSPVFEAPLGPYGWLNQRIFTCRIRLGAPAAPPSVHRSVYELTMPSVDNRRPSISACMSAEVRSLAGRAHRSAPSCSA